MFIHEQFSSHCMNYIVPWALGTLFKSGKREQLLPTRPPFLLLETQAEESPNGCLDIHRDGNFGSHSDGEGPGMQMFCIACGQSARGEPSYTVAGSGEAVHGDLPHGLSLKHVCCRLGGLEPPWG